MEIKTREYELDDLAGAMRAVIDSGGEFRFLPRGTSMLPYLREGRDSVALARLPDDGPEKYDIVLYRRKNGIYVLHRVLGRDGSGYIMCGDNQLALEAGIAGSWIIGKVAAVYRGEKRVEAGSFSSRAYSRLWCLIPLRKCVFLLRRAAGKLKRMVKKQE